MNLPELASISLGFDENRWHRHRSPWRARVLMAWSRRGLVPFGSRSRAAASKEKCHRVRMSERHSTMTLGGKAHMRSSGKPPSGGPFARRAYHLPRIGPKVFLSLVLTQCLAP